MAHFIFAEFPFRVQISFGLCDADAELNPQSAILDPKLLGSFRTFRAVF